MMNANTYDQHNLDQHHVDRHNHDQHRHDQLCHDQPHHDQPHHDQHHHDQLCHDRLAPDGGEESTSWSSKRGDENNHRAGRQARAGPHFCLFCFVQFFVWCFYFFEATMEKQLDQDTICLLSSLFYSFYFLYFCCSFNFLFR